MLETNNRCWIDFLGSVSNLEYWQTCSNGFVSSNILQNLNWRKRPCICLWSNHTKGRPKYWWEYANNQCRIDFLGSVSNLEYWQTKHAPRVLFQVIYYKAWTEEKGRAFVTDQIILKADLNIDENMQFPTRNHAMKKKQF